MTVTLQNHLLTVRIEELGAQLCSVKNAAGQEYIWKADPAVWGRHAPLLFPVLGRLKDCKYTLNGKEYTIPTHGFARDSLFEVVAQSDTSASFRLQDSEGTRAVWPFPFVLTVTYTLEDNRLIKTCTVENPGDETMYFELGGHDGYVAPLAEGESMADYAVCVPGLEAISPYGMDPAGMLEPKLAPIPLENGRISLKPSTYGLDTVILEDLPQRRALLVDKAGNARLTLDFSDFPYLGLWTPDKPFDTNYVCIEPWSTLPDGNFMGRSLADKPGIRTLASGASTQLTQITTFN